MSKHLYELGKFQARMDQFASHGELKNLAGEIAMLRMLLEKIVRACEDDRELIDRKTPILDTVYRIQQTVQTCHYIEQKMGGLLDRARVTQFAESLMQLNKELIEQYVPNENDRAMFLKKLGQRILENVEQA